jgi:hypothetical protein
MNFWVRDVHTDQWQPVPPEGCTLMAGTYTVIAGSPQPHFTITIDIDQYPLPTSNGDTVPAHQPGMGVRHEQRLVRTNDEGIAVILPPTLLSPGVWEFRCHDADLIAELFGEGKFDTLSLRVLPVNALQEGKKFVIEAAEKVSSENYPSPLLTPVAGDASAAVPPAADMVEPTVPSSEPAHNQTASFSLLHNQLQGAPGDRLVLTGRIGSPGQLEARLYAQEEVIFETERAIRFPVESKTAVFSLPIPLPSSSWNGDLVGMLTLHPTDSTILPASLTFTVGCKAIPSPQESEAPTPSDMRSTLASESLSQSPFDPADIPEEQRMRAPLGPVPEFQTGEVVNSNSPFSLRTWQKLIKFSTTSPTPSPLKSSTAASPPPSSVKQPESPPHPSPQPQDLNPEPPPPSPLSQASEPELSPPPQDHEPEPLPPPPPHPTPQPQPVSPTFSGSPASLHPPEIQLPEVLQAGDTLDIAFYLPEQPEGGPLPWIKFWVKQGGQSRSLVDGPRWLLDFTTDSQQRSYALTRMTVPYRCPELIFEAWTVSQDLQKKSEHRVVRRAVQT